MNIREALAEQPAQQHGAPTWWRPSNEQFSAWCRRHLMHPSDRVAFEDAATLFLLSFASLVQQPAQQQEPVYFCDYGYEGWGKVDADMAAANLADGMTVEAYYTSPPASKPWVGLTDAELAQVMEAVNFTYNPTTFARAIEAKLREKNA